MKRLLRGSVSSRALMRLGIQPRSFWLLFDLFAELSDRGEMLDQLGRDGVALRTVSYVYCGLSVLLSLMLVLARPPLATYMTATLAVSTLLLATVMLSETGNTLVNPVEALVLAHHPLNGATYTGAKLAHLLAIILFLVPAVSAAPAIGGLFIATAGWWYPVSHLGVAFALALLVALLSCALYGWLLRFLPPQRLRSAAQTLSAVPMLVFFVWDRAIKIIGGLHLESLLPASPVARGAIAALFGAAIVFATVFGLRSLSVDYLIRVSAMVRGGAAPHSAPRRSLVGGIVARLFGGQPGRAAAAFLSRMMARDFQFRRQMISSLVPLAVMLVAAVANNWRTDPFSSRFTPIHAMPHAIGFISLVICSVLRYGAHPKGRWIFQLAPAGALGAFARGLHAALWLEWLVVPHVIATVAFGFAWGFGHAAFFTMYSLAVASVYLALQLTLVDAVPFTKPFDPKRGASLLPIMMIGGMVVAAALAIQHFVLFRSVTRVILATLVISLTAFWLTRRSIFSLEAAMRYDLAVLSDEPGRLYTEVSA